MKIRVLIISCLFVFCLACEQSDYPYFIKNPCIGTRFGHQKALIVWSYASEEEYGRIPLETYLTKAGVEVLEFNAGDALTAEYLEQNQFTQAWVISDQSKVITQPTIDALYKFSEAGGSLSLLTDNFPFTENCVELAGQFGVTYEASGTVYVGPLQKSDGTLKEHCLTLGIDAIEGGITPCNIKFPEDDTKYSLIGRRGTDTMFVVFNDSVRRVFFDSAWTRYQLPGGNPDPATQHFIDNIVSFLECKCN